MLPHYLWKVKSSNLQQVAHQIDVSQSVMVSVGISKLDLTDLIFVDPGVTINGGYYCDMLLSQQLLRMTCDLSVDFIIFQHTHTLGTQQCEIS